MIYCGIDIGSRNTKLAVFDSSSSSLIYSAFTATKVKISDSIRELLEDLWQKQSTIAKSIKKTYSTGYGRHLFAEADAAISEIVSHAAGVRYFFPDCHSIIDIGGQDSKGIALSANAKVEDFVMNDKCAAGTGRFLEMTAIRLGCEVHELASIGNQADKNLRLNSTCVVFAESEIVNLMASEESIPNITRAVHNSIAHRIAAQISSICRVPQFVFTGGVAQNEDLARCLALELKQEILIPPDPGITGALGAAIVAYQQD